MAHEGVNAGGAFDSGQIGGGCSYVVAPAAVAPMCHIVEGLRVRIEEGVDEPEGWLPCRAAQTVELCNDGREDWGRGRRAVRPRRVVTAELASIDVILILRATEGSIRSGGTRKVSVPTDTESSTSQARRFI